MSEKLRVVGGLSADMLSFLVKVRLCGLGVKMFWKQKRMGRLVGSVMLRG